MTAALTPRERRLLDAIERLCRAGRIVEPILRGGLCPKCEAEPPTGDDLPDAVEFALAMCSNEDWSDLHDSLEAAEAEVADAQLDAVRPGRERIADIADSIVALDFAITQGPRP